MLVNTGHSFEECPVVTSRDYKFLLDISYRHSFLQSDTSLLHSVRSLLAHRREIRKLAQQTREKGLTLVPLKMYFLNGRAKLLIGLGRGKGRADKRHDLADKQARRDIDRAMSKRARK